VLFSSGQAPAVIDFVPYWRPRELAAAIFVADAMLWERASAKLADEAGLDHVFWQLLVRAALRRLLVLDIHSQRGEVAKRELNQVARHQWFANWLESLKR